MTIERVKGLVLNTDFSHFRQGDAKFAPFITRAYDRNVTIVGLDYPVHYRKPQAGSAEPSRPLPVAPVKPLEDVRDLILRHADSRITDAYFDNIAFCTGCYSYTAAAGSVFDCIIDDIRKCLLQEFDISVQFKLMLVVLANEIEG